MTNTCSYNFIQKVIILLVRAGYVSCNHVDGWWVTRLHMRRDWGPPLVWSETTNWDQSTIFIYSLITMITPKLHMVKFRPRENQGSVKRQHFLFSDWFETFIFSKFLLKIPNISPICFLYEYCSCFNISLCWHKQMCPGKGTSYLRYNACYRMSYFLYTGHFAILNCSCHIEPP